MISIAYLKVNLPLNTILLLLIYSIPSIIRHSIPRSYCQISCQSDEIAMAPMIDCCRKSNGLVIGNPMAFP